MTKRIHCKEKIWYIPAYLDLFVNMENVEPLIFHRSNQVNNQNGKFRLDESQYKTTKDANKQHTESNSNQWQVNGMQVVYTLFRICSQ